MPQDEIEENEEEQDGNVLMFGIPQTKTVSVLQLLHSENKNVLLYRLLQSLSPTIKIHFLQMHRYYL